MNDLKFAFRQLLKNPGFTVHPPQCRRADRVQIPQGCSRKAGHLRQYSYGGRAVAVLTLALGIGTNTAINICSDKTPSSLQRQTLLPVARFTAGMSHGPDEDAILQNLVDDAVGKPPRQDPAQIPADLPMCFREEPSSLDALLDLSHKRH